MKMKKSRHYQRILQITSAGSKVCLFFSGYLLGAGAFLPAAGLLVIRIVAALIVSEMKYKRTQALFREEVNHVDEGEVE